MCGAKKLNNYLHADFLSLFKRFAERERETEKTPFALKTMLLKCKVKVKIVVSPVHESWNK